MEKPVWDASLSAELRDGIVQCIRAARDWEFSCVAANGARIRIVNVGGTAQLRRLLDAVDGHPHPLEVVHAEER